MNKEEKIEEFYEIMKEVEEDIKVLQSNMSKARECLEYLKNTNTEDIDDDCFENLDIEKGLKHIALF